MEILNVHGVKLPFEPTIVRPDLAEKIRKGHYENLEVARLRKLLRDGDRVLDIGSGLGVTSTVAAQSPGVEAVATFEANPFSIDFIREVHEMNEVEVDLYHGMLLQEGAGPPTAFSVHELITASSEYRTHPGSTKKVEVPTYSIRSFLEEFQPTIISCDIEGSEYKLLLGLEMPSVRSMVIEMHPTILGQEKIDALQMYFEGIGLAKDEKFSDGNVHIYSRPGIMEKALSGVKNALGAGKSGT